MTIRQVLEDKELKRLEKSINKTHSCWNWIGNINRAGYGQCYLKGKMFKAHRAMYELLVGKIPVGLQIDHLCRNRKCVNPTHMEVVDQRTNILRGNGASARNARKKCCPKCGNDFIFRKGGRMCPVCHKDYMSRNSWKQTLKRKIQRRQAKMIRGQNTQKGE